MCLNYVYKGYPKWTKGYKVLSREANGMLYPSVRTGLNPLSENGVIRPIPIGVWVSEEDYRKPWVGNVMATNGAYPVGFHVYRAFGPAKKWATEVRVGGTDQEVFEVEVAGPRAHGGQDGGRVGVFARIRVIRQVWPREAEKDA